MSKGAIFAIDIETRGQGPVSHGLISIGVCVGSTTAEKVIDKRRFDFLPLTDQQMEKRCWDEFWSVNQPQLKKLKQNAQDPIKQIKAFRTFLDEIDQRFDSVYILSDNPGFDFGVINYYLDLAKLSVLNYKQTKDGKLEYRNNHDADSYARGKLSYGFDQQWISNEDVVKVVGANHLNTKDHDHMPENDAEFIYKLHYNVVVNK